MFISCGVGFRTDVQSTVDTGASASSTMRRRLLRGGIEGNERLTGTTALVLLLLLAAEGATIPFIHRQLTLHVFLGLVLVPPVLLKLTSTGWRFARYYFGDPDYRRRGAPQALVRFLVAPLTVMSTAALFGTGVLLVLDRPQRGFVLGLHKASFVVWFGAMTVHVLIHVLKVPALVRADVTSPSAGARVRRFAVAGAVVAGVVIAIAALPAAHDWAHWAALHHRHDG